MNKPSKKSGIRLTKKRKFFFKIIMILFPFIFLFFIEGILQLFNYNGNVKLFVKHPQEVYRDYRMVNPEAGKKYFRKFEYTEPAYDLFLKDKPDSCFRIFVLGSSTAVGFPYDINLMFPRILQYRLQDAYPDKKIEVVNTAITAINSFTLLDYAGQILKEEPDAILIYAGHNEFYGAFGIGSNETTGKNRSLTLLHLKLMNLRLYRFLRNTIYGVGKSMVKDPSDDIHGTLMKRIVNKTEITYKSEDYNIAIQQYEKNISRIVEKAQKKNVPVFISELVSNIRDVEPFVSKETTDYPAAIEVYKAAREAEKKGDVKKAKSLYRQARDLDCLPFRAPSDINDIVRNVARKYNIYLVPMLKYFEYNSPNGIVGNNLITEHVHPNYKGYFLMAEAFYDELVNSKLIGEEIDKYKVKSFRYFMRNYGFTALDSLMAHHMVANLKYHWPFVGSREEFIDYRLIYKPVNLQDSMAFEAMKSKEYSIADAHYDLANIYEKNKEYYKAFREYNALVYTNPYLPDYYWGAAKCLVKIYDLQMALEYLNKSLEYEESFFAYFHAGDIYLSKNDLDKAIQYLEKANKMAEKDLKPDVMKKLYIAYTYNDQPDKANNMLNGIQTLDPEFRFQVPPRSYLYLKYIPKQIEPYVRQARDLIAKGNIDDALNILRFSLEIKDSHIANRLIGEIYITRKDKDNALYYFEKTYPEFYKDPNFMYNMVLLYYIDKNHDKAKKCLNEFRELFPDHPAIGQLEMMVNGMK